MQHKIAVIFTNVKKLEPYLVALRLVVLEPVPISVSDPVKPNQFHGMLLMGGTDIDPDFYHQPPGTFTEPPDRERDDFEIAFAQQAMQMQLPILAICRGVQLINVARGGSLIQDLPARRAQELTLTTKTIKQQSVAKPAGHA